ncbi:MAG: hypothetical protein OXC80_04255 [Gammaproteobacteria bacterium]|nr:hypothetical protein [Gammaproteobacteria bacterium]
MDFFTTALLIVLATFVFIITLTWIKRNPGKGAMKATNARLQELENQDYSALEARVTNLERILTDKKYVLKDEIDSL